METGLYLPCEIRAEGKGLHGTFPYNSLAIRADRGRVRKERFAARAFRYSVEAPAEEREIHLLMGHDFNKPLASKRAGTLRLMDSDAGLSFDVDELPDTSYVADLREQMRLGLVGGLSPGFIVPPKAVVPNAERLIPEPGNPGVMIREIAEAVLPEMSLVTRANYKETDVQFRSETLESERRRRLLYI